MLRIKGIPSKLKMFLKKRLKQKQNVQCGTMLQNNTSTAWHFKIHK